MPLFKYSQSYQWLDFSNRRVPSAATSTPLSITCCCSQLGRVLLPRREDGTVEVPSDLENQPVLSTCHRDGMVSFIMVESNAATGLRVSKWIVYHHLPSIVTLIFVTYYGVRGISNTHRSLHPSQEESWLAAKPGRYYRLHCAFALHSLRRRVFWPFQSLRRDAEREIAPVEVPEAPALWHLDFPRHRARV